MPEQMDGATWEAFKALREFDEELEIDVDYEAEQRATTEMVERLEAKFADHGLKFSQQFYGALPVQAFGYLDGLRFYFRFRHNWANLRVGPYDAEIEQLEYERTIEQLDRRKQETEALIASGELEDSVMTRWENRPAGPTPEFDTHFLPTRIVKAVGREGIPGEDGYLGFLTNDECFDIFSDLVNSLEDVPESEQINEYTRVWLYEGLDAASAWWDARYKVEPQAGAQGVSGADVDKDEQEEDHGDG